MPKKRRTRRPFVAALVSEPMCTFEYGITAEIFGQARPEMGKDWYEFVTVSASAAPMEALGGLKFESNFGLDVLDRADMIVIPGCSSIDSPISGEVRGRLLAAHRRGARLVSLCSGAFTLAATGLLDGKRATTHWRFADQLARRHPAVSVDPSVLYIDESPLFTSAGSAAGIDLLLHIVRLDYGPEKANSVARRLVMPAHRDGGQAQFIERPVPRSRNGQLAPLLDYLLANLGRKHRIADLAKRAAMSERTFVRRFVEATGASPGEWLIKARVDLARDHLEKEAASVEQVALAVGFGSAEGLRHHFKRRVGLAPTEYRTRFVTHRPVLREGSRGAKAL
jgi:AraC family transcriptional activator FtrA